MNLLIFGTNGQVARELRRLAPHAQFLSREDVDLIQPALCAEAVRASEADAVINAAAWTAVDRAETDEGTATIVNGEAPGAMARAAEAAGIPFVHISTDYVFDGSGSQPRSAHDHPAPLNAYGRSKLVGEQGIRQAGGNHAILRTSWVFSRWGSNFVKTMLSLGTKRNQLSVVGDQIGGPTAAHDIAQACLTIAERLRQDSATAGTYHYSGSPDVSWADFARVIFEKAELPVEVIDIPSSSYPTPARRPLNSRLNNEGISAFGLSRPSWQESLVKVIDDLRKDR